MPTKVVFITQNNDRKINIFLYSIQNPNGLRATLSKSVYSIPRIDISTNLKFKWKSIN